MKCVSVTEAPQPTGPRKRSPWAVEALDKMAALSFYHYPTTVSATGTELEAAFVKYRSMQSVVVDRLLGLGYGGVHLLVTFSLLHSDAPHLALVPLLTAALQGATVWAAAARPQSYARWRFPLYAFIIVWSMVEGSLLVRDVRPGPCPATPSGAFWLTQLMNTSTPWLIIHVMVFPLPMAQALLVNGAAAAAMAATNVTRCRRALGACPAGVDALGGALAGLQRLVGVFAAGSAAAAPAPRLAPCVAACSLAQLFAFAVVMHALWFNEYCSRLEFLAETDAVEVEWRLEALRRPRRTEQIAWGLELAWTFVFLAFVLFAAVPEALRWAELLL